MSMRNRSPYRCSSRLRSRRRRLLAEPLEDRRLLAVSFELNYVGGNSIGFNDPAQGDTFKAAFESAAARLGGWLLDDATVQMDVFSGPFDGSAVAKATSEVPTPPVGGGFVHGIVPAKILGEGDLNGAAADGRMEVFFFGGSDTFTYETDPAQVNADDEIDFQAVVIHELVHTLGFTSATNADGSDDSGEGITTPGTWSPFDQFLSDVDGNRLIDADSGSPTAFQMNTTVTGWPTHSVGGKGPDAGLFFDGPIATAVYGGRVPLYSPAAFSLESSVSHLDSEGFPSESFIFSPLTHLMSHAIIDNSVPQELTLLEKAILADIGIRVQEDELPSITAPANIVVEGNSQGGFLGLNQAVADYLNAAVATDLFDPNPTITHNKPAFLPLGQNTITFTATDTSGNLRSATSVISVFDTAAPTISVSPTSTTFEATGPDGVTGVTLPFVSTVSDIVDPSPIVTVNAGSSFPLGTTSATYSARDFRNNVATFDVDIIVLDTTPPDFSLPAAITIDSNLVDGADLTNTQLLNQIAAAATDLADTSLSITAQPDTFPIGTTSVTFTVTDDSGNAANATTALTVNDTSIVVTTLDDELDANPESDLGDLSLREAISLANARGGIDTIRFEPSLTGAVLLDASLGQLVITDPVSLNGLGRDVTTIDAQNMSRVIDISDSAGDVTIDGVTITGGLQGAEAEGGAGVRSNSAGTLTIRNATIRDNRVAGSAAAGAGVQMVAGNLNMSDTIVSGNRTTASFASGGGVWSGGGDVTVTRSTFSGNTTEASFASGGGLYVLDGTATISGSSFIGNTTAQNRSGGAAIALLSSDATIIDSTISGNSTAGSESPGGGIRAVFTPLRLVNSTVSGNITQASGGAGVYVDRGNLDIDNSTITGNQASGPGGGIGAPTASTDISLTIHNSIVAANTDAGTAPDFVGTGVLDGPTSVEFSLIGDNTGTTLAESQLADPVTGNIVGDPTSGGSINPLLGVLADNGGATQTHLLLEGSPAINAGDPMFDAAAFSPPVINDQRGENFPRISGRQVDIGSIEVMGDIAINWPNPADIVFGTLLGTEQLNAMASVAGTFEYSPSAGTLLSVGETQTLTATFTPDDLVAFSPTTATAFITVVKADPVLTWANPAPIMFGTELDSTQLNATSNVPGTFQYSPPAGTMLDAGVGRVLSATFTPTDANNFNSATTSVLIDVTTATPVVTWENPADVMFETRLGPDQLNATANVEGSFAYAPPEGVLLSVGLNQTLTVTFTPSSANFDPITETVMINVTKADPVIEWNTPSDIVAGTLLSATQLNAATNVLGTFTYNPPSGTQLGVGAGQQLTTTFTPGNLGNYNVTTATVLINVISPQDYGDAPSAYPVLLEDDGARHTATTLVLGSTIDLDIDGNPSDLADGDGDDEDGVTQVADSVAVTDADTVASFVVDVSEAGKLDAWVDFNGDGDWDDLGEQVFVSLDVSAGLNALSYTVPAGATPGDTAARFRLSSAGGLAPTGESVDGEVEDYLLSILDGNNSANANVDMVNGAVTVSTESGVITARSGPTVLFSAPVANLQLLSVVGGASVDTLTIELGPGFVTPGGGVALDGGDGGNTLVVIGDGGAIDLTNPLFDVTNFRKLDLSSSDANTVTIDATAVTELSPALKLLEIVAGEEDSIVAGDVEDWRLTDPINAGGMFKLTATNIAGGSERIEAELPHAWQNFLRAGDINNDGSVTAADALRIINELARRAFSDGDTQNLQDPFSLASWPGVYFDHSGDDRVTALDALRVINDLARLSLAGGSGEGETVAVALSELEREEHSIPRQTADGSVDVSRELVFDAATPDSISVAVSSIDSSRETTETQASAVDELLADEAFVETIS